MSLLEIKDLTIEYKGQEAVKNISFSLDNHQIIAVVGESGSGKSTLVKGIMGLLSADGSINNGEVIFEGKNLCVLSPLEFRKLRGNEICMVFQDAGLYFNPRKKVGKQFIESILVHQKMEWTKAEAIACELLEKMHFSNTDRVMKSYPFQLSGGMKQRVALGMAMAARPRLLLADEPTSALDVTIQAQVVRLMKDLRKDYGTAILIVTHNMGVASYIADDIAVMRNGKIVEFGKKDQIINHPEDAYTKKLLSAVPELEDKSLV